MPIFDTGTKTIFHQTSAPTGWTKETVNYNNHALRIVSGSTLGSGGSVDFTTAFSSTAYTYSNVPVPYTVGSHTLTRAQLPFHEHPLGPNLPSGGRFAISGTASLPASSVAPVTPSVPTIVVTESLPVGLSVGSSGAHNHTVTLTASGNVFSPNSTLGVNYIDVIIASLN